MKIKQKNDTIENELKKLKKFDASYFRGRIHFGEDGTQSYLVFQAIYKSNEIITNTKYISSWQSKGLSNETITPPTTSDNSLTPLIDYYGTKARVKFTESFLKQSTISTHKAIVNVYVVYTGSNDNDPTLKNCLFGAVTLTKNVDFEKYGYSGYGIGFDRDQVFHSQVVELVKMFYFLRQK